MSNGNNPKGQNRPQQPTQQPTQQPAKPPVPVENDAANTTPRVERRATLAILGAGPIGVEAALVASRLKICGLKKARLATTSIVGATSPPTPP